MKKIGLFFLLLLHVSAFGQDEAISKFVMISAAKETGFLSPPPAVFAPKEYSSLKNPALKGMGFFTIKEGRIGRKLA